MTVNPTPPNHQRFNDSGFIIRGTLLERLKAMSKAFDMPARHLIRNSLLAHLAYLEDKHLIDSEQESPVK